MDSIPTITFTIIGAPRTKNTGKVAPTASGKQRVIPPAPYRRWFKHAMQQWPVVRLAARGLQLPLTQPVEVTAVWFRDREAGDEDRYKIALGDFLQRSGLIRNDYQIHWGGDCRRDIDRARPRTEVTVRVLGPR